MSPVRITAIAAAMMMALGVAACDEPDGPAEQVGEAVDEAVNDVQRAAEDAAD